MTAVLTPFLDLESYIRFLEQSGRLKRVNKPVNKDWEIACITRWAIESTPEQDGYAILFENILNHTVPVVVNLYFSHDVYAAALGVNRNGVLEHWAGAMAGMREPVPAAIAPVQEIVEIGAAADLLKIPAPIWTPGRDAGPYLSAADVITKDPESGVQNLGNYRIQIHDSKRAGLFFGSEMQHGAIHYAKYVKRSQKMPVAIVVGAPPVVNFAAAAKTAYGIDELKIAGGLSNKGLEVIGAKAVDLLVPARAEYVIEGWVTPGGKLTEGPFGEAMGYMNMAAPAPVLEVAAICHRRAPFHHGYVQQLPPSEGHIVMEMGVLGPLWYYLTRYLRLPGLNDLAIARGSAGLAILLVQVRRREASCVRSIGSALAKINFGQKFICLLDEDIDIRDSDAVNWALSSRVDPERDIHIISNQRTFQQDPSTLARAAEHEDDFPPCSSIAILDATLKRSVPEISLPGQSLMLGVLEKWSETSLPSITPRRRIQRLLATHSEKDLQFPVAVSQ